MVATVNIHDLKCGCDWLKRVSGVDDEYREWWDITEWAEWYRAMDVSTDSTVNPCVPDWMNDMIQGDWSNDWSQPWPCIGQLWPTAQNWFLAEANRDDFTLQVARGDESKGASYPTLPQLDRAWWLAHEHPGSTCCLIHQLSPKRAAGPYESTVAGCGDYKV